MTISIIPTIESIAGLQPKGINYGYNITATGAWQATIYTIPANRVLHITSCALRIHTGAGTSLYAQTKDGLGAVELFTLIAVPSIDIPYGGVYDIYGEGSQPLQIGITVTSQPCYIQAWMCGVLYFRGEGQII